MAKVTGPLQSFSASGKVGKSLVFFAHLGRNVVRMLVTPSNPRSESQGNFRQITGGLGRSTKPVANPSDWLNDARQITSAGQTWVSEVIRHNFTTYMSTVSAFEAMVAELEAHTNTEEFETRAAANGWTDLEISYAGTEDSFSPGLQLYMLAKYTLDVAAANPTLWDRAPYTTALASWDSSEVQAFIDDLQEVAA